MSRRIRDKRDRVRQLRVFCSTARLGSVTRAAEYLGLSQPAVSLQLRELEYELGAELFERARSGMALTPAGERLQSLAGPLVGAVDGLFGDFRGALDASDSARVRLAVSSMGAAFVLPRYMKRFHDRHPDMTVRVDTVPFGKGCRLLLEEKVDLVLGPRDLGPEARLRYHELLAYERVLITAFDHPLAGRASVSLQEVGAYRMVVPPDDAYRRRLDESAGHALDFDVAVEVGDWGILKRYVEAGIGIALVPSLVVSDSDQLSVVALDADFPRQSFGLFTLHDRLLTAPARRFIEVLFPNAPERPPPPRSVTQRNQR